MGALTNKTAGKKPFPGNGRGVLPGGGKQADKPPVIKCVFCNSDCKEYGDGSVICKKNESHIIRQKGEAVCPICNEWSEGCRCYDSE